MQVSERVEGRKGKCAQGRKILPKWPSSFKGQVPREDYLLSPSTFLGIPAGALWKSKLGKGEARKRWAGRQEEEPAANAC